MVTQEHDQAGMTKPGRAQPDQGQASGAITRYAVSGIAQGLIGDSYRITQALSKAL